MYLIFQPETSNILSLAAIIIIIITDNNHPESMVE